MDMKELYICAHEELIAEMLDRKPGMSESIAYDRTADAAYERMKDNMADMADHQRSIRKGN